MTTPQFVRGNEARLDVTREELFALHRAVLRQRHSFEVQIKEKGWCGYYGNQVDIYNGLNDKIEKAEERYQ